ncbi:DUF4407 domain-containing protein [Streptosporangium sp. CA-115845]|uniref:DUF4407 domain-containing protein n=1 Tax=Streptosporangium sp. CA-115845 TaxID=3240071 RepID=UPI003D902FED
MLRLLIFLSGARRDVLERCPTETGKFAGLGSALLITSTLACVSMTFTLASLLGVNLVLAVIFGLGWGLSIMSLDRWLIGSINTDGPGRLWLALPRLAMSLLLGIVISTPLVLYIFKPEIDTQIVQIKLERANTFDQQLARGDVGTEISRLTKIINDLHKVIESRGDVALDPAKDPTVKTLSTQRDAAQRQANTSYDRWQCQLYGGSQCPKAIKGNGSQAQAAEQSYRAARQEIEKLNTQIVDRTRALTASSESARRARLAQAQADLPGYQEQLDRHLRQQNALRAQFDAQNQNPDGLLLRLTALNEISGTNTSLSLALLLLFLSLVLVECLPVIVKLMQRPGTYEKILAIIEHREFLMARERFLSAETALGEASGKVSLEEVWNRESYGSRHPPQPPPDILRPEEEDVEDQALRGMKDARTSPSPDDQVVRPPQGGGGHG